MHAAWLACVLATSGCATSGKAARPVVCPVLPVPPASLMQPATVGQRVRAELFEPQTNVPPK